MNRAGRSARTEYQRRRTSDRRIVRKNLPFTIPVLLLTPIVVYVAVRVGVHVFDGAFRSDISKSTKTTTAAHTSIVNTGGANLIAIVLALAATLGLAKEFWGRRASTEAWRLGAEGEERLGQILDGLRANGYAVLHDLGLPGSKANVDHLVIGPSGVWVIDAKNYSGRLTWSKGTLWHGRYPLTKTLGVTRWEAERVSQTLNSGRPGSKVAVIAVMCVLGASLPQPVMLVDGVRYRAARASSSRSAERRWCYRTRRFATSANEPTGTSRSGEGAWGRHYRLRRVPPGSK